MSPSALDDYRAQLRDRAQKAEAAAPPPWRFPDLNRDFRQYQHVLAFDATLTNCGWVFFSILLGSVAVIDKGTIKPKTTEVGYLSTWDKADQLRAEIEGRIARCRMSDHRTRIVVEAPSVGGGSRTESSLIAGLMVWSGRRGDCSVVSATHVSAVLLGDPRMKSAPRKKAVKEAVVRLYPGAAGRDWNEHERDGLATGLVDLYDIQRKGQR